MKNYKIIPLLAFLCLLPALALAVEPDGYYSSCEGTYGATLLSKLRQKISNHTVRSYANLWTDYGTTDVDENGKIYDIYTDKRWSFQKEQCGTVGTTVGVCYNREHSFPKSWFGGEVSPMYTDLFHLYPADGRVNSQRNNYPYGECASGTYIASDGVNNATGKLGACTFPGYSGTVFEPADEYKGDLARTYFYMAACYNDLIAGWNSSDASKMLNQTAYPAFKDWAVELLLKWHRQDPVSAKELARNEAVYGIQHNRNPFIDHPELVEYIWGERKTTAWYISDNSNPEIVIPVNGSTVSFGTAAVDHTVSTTVMVRGFMLTAPVQVAISGSGLSADRTSIPAAEANTDTGAPLEISWSPTAPGVLNATLTLTCGSLTSTVSLTGEAVSGLPVLDASHIASTSFTANWIYIGDANGGKYTLHLLDASNNPISGYPKQVDALAGSYPVEGLQPQTTYHYYLQSSSMTSSTVEVTTTALVPFITASISNHTLFAQPGNPSPSSVLEIEAVNIFSDITVSVPTPFQISPDEGDTWAQQIQISPSTTSILIRMAAAPEGSYSGTVTFTADSYTFDHFEIAGLVGSTSPLKTTYFVPENGTSPSESGTTVWIYNGEHSTTNANSTKSLTLAADGLDFHSSDVTVAFAKGSHQSSHPTWISTTAFRMYKGNTFTLTPLGGTTIRKVEIVMSTAKSFTVQETSISPVNKVVTWEGESTIPLVFTSDDKPEVRYIAVYTGGDVIVTRPELFRPLNGASYNFGTIILGNSASTNLPVKGSGLTQNVSVQYSADGLTISPTSFSASEVCTDTGTRATITWQPAEEGALDAQISVWSTEVTSTVTVTGYACRQSVALPSPDHNHSLFIAAWEDTGDYIDDGKYRLHVTTVDDSEIEGYPILVDATAGQCNVPDLEAETTYKYYIEAGHTRSNTVEVTTSHRPVIVETEVYFIADGFEFTAPEGAVTVTLTNPNGDTSNTNTFKNRDKNLAAEGYSFTPEGAPVNLSFSNGTNTGNCPTVWYNSGNPIGQIRFYRNNTITLASTAEDVQISKVMLQFVSGNAVTMQVDDTNLTPVSNQSTWEGVHPASSITLASKDGNGTAYCRYIMVRLQREVSSAPDPTPEPALISPTNGASYDLGTVTIGSTATMNLTVKGSNLSQAVTLQESTGVLNISPTSLPASEICTESGANAEISWRPIEEGPINVQINLSSSEVSVSVNITGYACPQTDPDPDPQTEIIETDVYFIADGLEFTAPEDAVTVTLVNNGGDTSGTNSVSNKDKTLAADNYSFTPEGTSVTLSFSNDINNNNCPTVWYRSGAATKDFRFYKNNTFTLESSDEDTKISQVIVQFVTDKAVPLLFGSTEISPDGTHCTWEPTDAVDNITVTSKDSNSAAQCQYIMVRLQKEVAIEQPDPDPEPDPDVVIPDEFGLLETFEAISDASKYTEDDYESNLLSWHFDNAGIWPSDDAYGETNCVRFGNESNSSITMTKCKAGGAGRVSFFVRKWSATEADATLRVDISTDKGLTWSEIANTTISNTAPSSVSGMQRASVNVTSTDYREVTADPNVSGNVRLRIMQTAGKRLMLDHLSIANYDGPMTGITDINASAATIVAVAGGIEVTTAAEADVAVYSIDGMQIIRAIQAAGTSCYSLPSGFYIVKAGQNAVRVIVR